MNRICKRIFIYSLMIYLISTAFVRTKEAGGGIFGNSLFNLLPLDAYPLKYIEGTDSISYQVGVLSNLEVIELLKTNPDVFPGVYEGMTFDGVKTSQKNKDYVVLRFKGSYCWGGIKCYFSCFCYPILQKITLKSPESYYNVIFPYPECHDDLRSCDISLKWGYFKY
jgi:hypothetical protein